MAKVIWLHNLTTTTKKIEINKHNVNVQHK